MYKLLLSLRFFRMRRINLLSVVCIALGVMVLIIVYSVMEGFQHRLKDAFRRTTPHVLVERLHPAHTPAEYEAVLAKVPGVKGVTTRVELLALMGWVNDEGANTIGSSSAQRGITCYAIDAKKEDRVTDFKAMLSGLHDDLKHLEVPDPGNPFHISDELRRGRRPLPGIIVGQELAKYLRLSRGDEVTVFTIRLDPTAKRGLEDQVKGSNDAFYLAGVFRSGMYEKNLFTVYVPMASGKEMLARAGYASEKIAIGCEDFDDAEAVEQACRTALKKAGFFGERLTTWQDRNKTFLQALVVEKRVLIVLMFFLVLMACGTILAILYMMVLEKRREIGILKALGAPMRGLLQLFLLNGGVIGALGAVFGVGFGLLFLRYINNIEGLLSRVFGLKVFPKEVYVFDSMPVVYDAFAIGLTAVATVLFSLLAALIPAYIAARSDPVRSLRNE